MSSIDKTKKQVAEEIIENYYSEFSLLRSRYSSLNLSDLEALVGNDWSYLKEYKDCPDCINGSKVATFVEFLKEFKFYIQGKGTIWPENFHLIDYCEVPTGKHLGDEMEKTLVAALKKENNGEEAGI